MATKIKALKGQLKLDPKLNAIAKDKKKEDKGENKGKKKNKKDTSNKKYQKKDEAWKKVPPKDTDPKEKQVGKYTFQWCEHHMAWMAHKPQDCHLNPKHKDNKKTSTKPTLLSSHPRPLSLQPPPPSTIATRLYWPRSQP
jgi:hypothetical protein